MKKMIPLLLVFYVISVSAQTDSLQRLLQNEKSDTAKVLLLEELSRIYSTSQTDTSLVLAQQALMLSRKIGFEKGEAMSLNRIGTVFSSIGNYPQALENLLGSLKINEKIGNMDGIMRNYGNIANVNAELGDYAEGLHYSFLEKQNAEKVHDDTRLTNTLLRIGDIYEKLNMLDSARMFTQQAQELAVKLNDDYAISIALNNMGNIYSKMNERRPSMYPVSIAMEFYRSSLNIYKDNNDDEGISESALGMARLFKRKKQMDSSLFYGKWSLEAADRGGFTSYKLDASQFLSGYYHEKNRLDSAFHYQQIMIAAKDSLFSQEKIKQVQTLSFEERKRQQQLEEERNKAEIERRNNIQLTGIATVIVLLFLFLLLISRRKTNAKVVEVFGLISLLFLFEFISLFIHPFIAELTNHTPVLMMLILVGVAALLIPVHHHMEKWVKEKLANKIRTVSRSVVAAIRPDRGRDRGEITP